MYRTAVAECNVPMCNYRVCNDTRFEIKNQPLRHVAIRVTLVVSIFVIKIIICNHLEVYVQCLICKHLWYLVSNFIFVKLFFILLPMDLYSEKSLKKKNM